MILHGLGQSIEIVITEVGSGPFGQYIHVVREDVVSVLILLGRLRMVSVSQLRVCPPRWD